MPVAPINIVGRGLPFHSTVEHGNKLLPFTVSVRATTPDTGAVTTFASEGESGREMTGTARFVVGAVIEKLTEFEETVPLETVMATVPTNAVSVGAIAAVSCVALTKAVGRGDPFQLTTTFGAKLVPFTVSVSGDVEQFVVPVGEIVVMAGATIDAEIELDTDPPVAGFDTVTGTIPTAAISGAVIAAWSCVVLPNVVGRLRPFHCTPEQGTKPVPVTLKVNAAAPAVKVAGEIESIVAAGIVAAEIVKADGLESTPELETVTDAVPEDAISEAVITAVRYGGGFGCACVAGGWT
jgi:hypothetical protein